jgi:Tol biopolymer transport system component
MLMNHRAFALTVLTLAVLSVACTSQAGPEDPTGSGPQGPGTLEATVVVGGSRPDPDGYSAVVSPGSDGEPKVERVDAAGGTIRFPNLPPGSHSILLEDLADNCLVVGANPHSFTIVSEEVTPVELRVACPGPGSFLIKTVTQGVDLARDGYSLLFEGSSIREERVGINDSLLIREEDLSPDGIWIVRLGGVPDHCGVGWAVSDNRAVVRSDPLELRLPREVTVRVTFSVTCIQPSSRIAFEGISGDIFLANSTSGSGTVNLTNDAAIDGGPALSPDGTRIVFSSNRDFPWDFATDLYAIDADGNRLRRLTTTGADWVGSQAWSPDGSRIVFTSLRDDPNGEIYVMNADGSGVIRLTDNDAADLNPAWSPDGSSIAFCSDRGSTGGSLDIYRMSASDGSAIVKMASGGCDPAWSPDGSRIAYTTDMETNSDLAVIGVDGTGFVQLHPLSTTSYASRPSWSPDGSWIAFSGFDRSSKVMIVRFERDQFGEVANFADGASPSWR